MLGEFDANLALIENKLGLRAVVHGNVVVLDGDKEMLSSGQNGSGDALSAGQEAMERPHPRRCGRGYPTFDEPSAKAQAPGLDAPQPVPPLGELKTRKRTVIARTPAQSAYIKALQSREMVFGTGPAGTGKTYLAVAYAAGCLERGEVDRLDSVPACGGGGRTPWLSSWGYEGKSRSLFAAAL